MISVPLHPGQLDEDEGRSRYIRSCNAANAAAAAAAYHHPHELHPGYDSLEAASEFDRYAQQRPVDLGNYNRSYSPNAAAAVVAAASDGWAPNHWAPDLIDARTATAAGQHASAGLPWPPHSHEPRYMSTTTKWEPNAAGVGAGPLSSGGAYKKKHKANLLSPGSQGGGSGTSTCTLSSPNDLIPDETLQHLTVKELNKRVQNLARDEVVALKQRRRTLKNRG